MEPVIVLEAAHKCYSSGDIAVDAVRDVSLTISKGEFIAILGPSGSGKSTLMHILGCQARLTSGHYLLDGVDVCTLSNDELALIRNRKLGFIFQSYNLLARWTAFENVELQMLCGDQLLSADERRARALHCLAEVGLSHRASHLPSQLSGGQQQRVAIARALANQPSVILADEPTGNLDSKTSIEVMRIFQQFNDAGATIVMVTHELDIARYCKRNIVLRDGCIVRDAPVLDRLVASEELQRLVAEEAAASITHSVAET